MKQETSNGATAPEMSSTFFTNGNIFTSNPDRKEFIQSLFRDQIYKTGWILIVVSTIVFNLPFLTNKRAEDFAGLFIAHYCIALLYFFYVKYVISKIDTERFIHYRMITLVLFLISAYALNRDMEVFSASPVWLCLVLVSVCVNYLSLVFFPILPNWARHVQFFVLGISLTLFVYLSFYLMPLYLVSFIALLALGISIHSFIPILFSYYSIVLPLKLSKSNKRYWFSFASGLVIILTVCAVFTSSWKYRINRINEEYIMSMVDGSGRLPVWVQVAQRLPNDRLSEKVLKTNIVFKSRIAGDNLFWNIPSRNFGEQQQLHDPLVIMACNFSKPLMLPEEDRIKILESRHKARHQAQERLWSGEHVHTENVATRVRVWPSLHLAYTEKFITVFSDKQQQWRGDEEAIFSFHLPEGGVVTSLSLWINGKEEKAILTTKEKAENAYKTIVGVETRDPSLVHWQEGNTVSVRVFPVLPQSSRSFKIGITAPLQKQGERLVYENIWFEGPDASSARETLKLDMGHESNQLIKTSEIKELNVENADERQYKPRWSLEFNDPGMRSAAFSFNGFQYSMTPYQPRAIPATISDVYLDLNRSWSDEDLLGIWKAVQGKRVWVYDGKMQELTEANRHKVFDRLKEHHFSFFPFQLLHDREKSIVISKSFDEAPNLSDLEGSPFAQSLKADMNQVRVKFFQLGNQCAPYIRTLREFRFFNYDQGSVQKIADMLGRGYYISDAENAREVIVHSAGVVLRKQEGMSVSNAPDHLMRIFTYNHLLQRIGKKGLSAIEADSTMLTEAREAYVVSPVSSLIVLESQKDYDRFDIHDKGASLKNASMNNKGAVPEPAEWALIILSAGVLLFFYLKWKIS
jgi:XrtN system VIT domain protein